MRTSICEGKSLIRVVFSGKFCNSTGIWNEFSTSSFNPCMNQNTSDSNTKPRKVNNSRVRS